MRKKLFITLALVCIVLCPFSSHSQDIDLSGVVVDMHNTPVQGVAVFQFSEGLLIFPR